jgi:alkaline phosphatase D
MTIGRRAFLSGAALSGAALVAGTRLPVGARVMQGPLTDNPFTLGVASGDPLPDRVILWTRLAPDPLNGGGMPNHDVDVAWEVAADPGFGSIVASGTEPARVVHGHAVHVDATGLAPDAWYYYRFSTGGYDSPVGRTRTAPPPDCTPDAVRFGFASCQSYPSGYYTAHQHLAQEDLDLVFFLGDYIYEGGSGGPIRSHDGPEVTTLAQYRNRYALYRSDTDLQASHAAFPWVVIWDDHEVDNNYAGAVAENGSSGFLDRRAAAYQAWWEHQPVRMAPPVGADLPIYRSFAWGDLASFFALDGRQHRDTQACGHSDMVGPTCAEREDPARSMLGWDQEAWLESGLDASAATWNVLANQTVMTGMPIVGAYNMDQWDGYPEARQRLFDVLGRPDVSNPVVITGDIHMSMVSDLKPHLLSQAYGTELVGTSITSSFPSNLAALAEEFLPKLDWVDWVNATKRGYVRVDLDSERMLADYRLVDTVEVETSAIATETSWTVEAGVSGIAECDTPDPTTTTTSTSTTTPQTTTETTAGSTTGGPTSSTEPVAPTPTAAPTATAQPIISIPTFTG